MHSRNVIYLFLRPNQSVKAEKIESLQCTDICLRRFTVCVWVCVCVGECVDGVGVFFNAFLEVIILKMFPIAFNEDRKMTIFTCNPLNTKSYAWKIITFHLPACHTSILIQTRNVVPIMPFLIPNNREDLYEIQYFDKSNVDFQIVLYFIWCAWNHQTFFKGIATG